MLVYKASKQIRLSQYNRSWNYWISKGYSYHIS